MVSQKRVKPHMRKLPGTRRMIRIRGHLREVDGRMKRNK